MNFRHDPACMACRPDGLGMRLRADGEQVVGTVTLDDRHAGNAGIAHGGMVATILDEALGSVPLALDAPSVTASLTIEYRAPALLGRELAVRAWCEGREGRKLHLRGELRDDERVLAEARGMWVQVDAEHFERIGLAPPAVWR